MFYTKHPIARIAQYWSVLQTLLNSERALFTSSTQLSEDEITKDNQSMVLGAPHTTGIQLYLDLQQQYTSSYVNQVH